LEPPHRDSYRHFGKYLISIGGNNVKKNQYTMLLVLSFYLLTLCLSCVSAFANTSKPRLPTIEVYGETPPDENEVENDEEEPTDETPADETPTDETPPDEIPTDETPPDEIPPYQEEDPVDDSRNKEREELEAAGCDIGESGLFLLALLFMLIGGK
jgi:hypothetical protein